MFRVIGLVLVIWACVISYWLITEVSPDGRQMLTWLGIVPAVVVVLWLGAMLWRAVDMRRKERAAQAGEAGTPPSSDSKAADEGVEADPLPKLALLASACRLPALGDAQGEQVDPMQLPRLALHPQLRDEHGLPVHAAWLEDIEPEAGGVVAAGQLHEHELRMLALIEPVLLSLFEQLQPLAGPARERALSEQVVAGLRRVQGERTATMVGAHLHLPAGVSTELVDTLRDMVDAHARASGIHLQDGQCHVIAGADADSVWSALELLGRGATGDPGPQLHVAVGSMLSQSCIDLLCRQQQLASAMHVDGVIPAEGAAGVVVGMDSLTTAVLPVQGHLAGPLRASVAHLRMRRMRTDLLVELVGRVDAPAAITDDSTMVALSDAGQGSAAAIEVTSAFASFWPGVDVTRQALMLGAHAGDLGPVAPLALIAVAGARLRAGSGPLVLAGVGRSDQRAAAVLYPPTSEPPQAPAPVPAMSVED